MGKVLDNVHEVYEQRKRRSVDLGLPADVARARVAVDMKVRDDVGRSLPSDLTYSSALSAAFSPCRTFTRVKRLEW